MEGVPVLGKVLIYFNNWSKTPHIYALPWSPSQKMGHGSTLLQAIQAILHSDSWNGPDRDA